MLRLSWLSPICFFSWSNLDWALFNSSSFVKSCYSKSSIFAFFCFSIYSIFSLTLFSTLLSFSWCTLVTRSLSTFSLIVMPSSRYNCKHCCRAFSSMESFSPFPCKLMISSPFLALCCFRRLLFRFSICFMRSKLNYGSLPAVLGRALLLLLLRLSRPVRGFYVPDTLLNV